MPRSPRPLTPPLSAWGERERHPGLRRRLPIAFTHRATPMSNEPIPAYHHTQKAPWALLIAAVGVASILGAVLIWHVPTAPVALAVAGVGMLVLATAFRQLTVTDEGDHLLVAFGPLPLFTKRICYADIRSVEVGRTWLVEGW